MEDIWKIGCVFAESAHYDILGFLEEVAPQWSRVDKVKGPKDLWYGQPTGASLHGEVRSGTQRSYRE